MRVYRVIVRSGETIAAWSDYGQDFFRLDGSFPQYDATSDRIEGVVGFAAPLQPTTIYCIGLNYRAHAAETGAELPKYPVLFMKSPTAVTGPNDSIFLPRKLRSSKVDYEVELAVVIGKTGKNIPADRAMDHVFGFTVANDVSARDWQKHAGSGQWVRAKTFDTFCPLGPCIATREVIPEPGNLRLFSRVNGEQRQDSSTADLIFPIPELIEYVSGSTTLAAGTLILTGTPAGVGMGMRPMRFLERGDVVECTIEGIGTLRNTVEEEVVGDRHP